MTSIPAPPVPLSQVGRAAHDIGLAGLLGGNLFGRLALHPSVTRISDKVGGEAYRPPARSPRASREPIDGGRAARVASRLMADPTHGPSVMNVRLPHCPGGFAATTPRRANRVSSSDAYARRLAERLVDEEPLRDCRRFGTRRVDCVYGGDSRCQPVVSLQLRPTGVIWTRGDRCEDVKDAFRRHPEWDGPAWPLGAPDV